MSRSPQIIADEIIREAWVYSGGSQTPFDFGWTTRERMKLWPVDKQICAIFCGMLLAGYHPGPELEMWIKLAFCTCKDVQAEKDLAYLYRVLLRKCTFDEFLTAYQSSQLYSLFKSRGLDGALQSSHPLVEDVLKTSPTMNLSVWNLKQSVLTEATTVTDKNIYIITAPVVVDYGFGNCRTFDEVGDLKAIYKTLFNDARCEPHELHRACVQGRLFQYAQGLVKMSKRSKKKYRRLMKNPYPIPDNCPCQADSIAGISLSPQNLTTGGHGYVFWAILAGFLASLVFAISHFYYL